jgi:GNAT superfamily N-acetyltransferase
VSVVAKGFDGGLWIAGIKEGAFSGDRDKGGVWYTLEVDGVKVALAAATPGPADLTNISYYVHPDHRGHGYGTKIASQVTDLHEKATFTIFKDNDASIKVALAALRNKFAMTMGRNVVRLTKTADAIPGGKADKKKPGDFNAEALAEGAKHEREHTSSDAVAQEIAMDHLAEDPQYYVKLRKIEKKALAIKDERNTIGTTLSSRIHESFTVAADRMTQAGMLSERERIELSGAIGEMLGRLKRTVNRDVASREMTPHAHDLLKKATSAKRGLAAFETLVIKAKEKGLTSPQAVARRISDAAGRVAKAPAGQLSPEERKKILKASRFVRVNLKDPKGGEIYKRIMAGSLNKSHQMELDLAKKSSDESREHSIQAGRKALHKMVRPFGGVYKTKGAKGWDVMVDAMMSDTQSSPSQ